MQKLICYVRLDPRVDMFPKWQQLPCPSGMVIGDVAMNQQDTFAQQKFKYFAVNVTLCVLRFFIFISSVVTRHSANIRLENGVYRK